MHWACTPDMTYTCAAGKASGTARGGAQRQSATLTASVVCHAGARFTRACMVTIRGKGLGGGQSGAAAAVARAPPAARVEPAAATATAPALTPRSRSFPDTPGRTMKGARQQAGGQRRRGALEHLVFRKLLPGWVCRRSGTCEPLAQAAGPRNAEEVCLLPGRR